MNDPVRGDVSEVDDGPEYDLNVREHPERYRHTSDEQGAFKIAPYKGELLPDWTISDLGPAAEAAQTIHDRYREYRDADDFVGMDMARKYLQMGWTRSMRYAKYPGGQKYVDGEARSASDSGSGETANNGEEREPQTWYDPEKRRIARIYRFHLDRVRDDDAYARAKARHRERYGED